MICTRDVTVRLPEPRTLSEWQLCTVLQRANLLQYFDIFIAQGGDDLQQLLEAHEEEFLEIMVLVGMANKPLHVRRMQKALQEYSQNPARFQMLAMQILGSPPPSCSSQCLAMLPATFTPCKLVTQSSGIGVSSSSHNANQWSNTACAFLPTVAFFSGFAGPSATATVVPGSFLTTFAPPRNADTPPDYFCDQPSTSSSSEPGGYNHCVSPTPILTDEQLHKVVDCSIAVVHSLPQYEPRLVQNKKKISKDLLAVMALPEDSPARADEFRRYSAIYGRFDAKRKTKPLTAHEASVNEAAAQICMLRPALLTRRDELFPLARQVVKDVGYNYVKGPKKCPETVDTREGRKRATPAESVASDRSRTPTSSLGDSPSPSAFPCSSADYSPKHRRSHSKNVHKDKDHQLAQSLRDVTNPQQHVQVEHGDMQQISQHCWMLTVVKEEPANGDD